MRSNTNELRKQLKVALSGCCSEIYYQEGISKKKYPYVVFELSELNVKDGKTQYKCEVNCICKSNTEAENLADEVQDVMDGYSFSNNKIAFHTYRSQRNAVYEEDKSIKRRRLIFELYFYSKEEE